jgi:hypothetical protein
VKAACDVFGSNLEADDLVAWSEINAEILARSILVTRTPQLLSNGKTTDELGESDKGSASDRNIDDSCEVVLPILKQSARKYCDMMPDSQNSRATVDVHC